MQSGLLVQRMPIPREQQKPRAQATWLQTPVGLEERAPNVAMAMVASRRQAGVCARKIAPA